MTLAELVAVLGQALGTEYEGVRNGRVRDLPDARTIRWYQTLGMVERPASFRGRTALYVRRHVLQLAAIKKLQASGLPLADIQRGLAGRTDAELARAAGLRLADIDRLVAGAFEVRSRREAATLRAALRPEPASRRTTAFWKASASVESAPRPEPDAAPGEPAASIQSLSLAGGLALVWSGRPLTAGERDAVTRLSRPIVEFLSSRGPGTTAERARDAASLPARRDQTQGDRP